MIIYSPSFITRYMIKWRCDFEMVKEYQTKTLSAREEGILEVMYNNQSGQLLSKSDKAVKLSVTFCHVVKSIRKLINSGVIIEPKKVGRAKPVSLTKKGEKMAQKLVEYKSELAKFKLE